jgi:cyclohexanecarboxylate-CoA ligase
VSPHAAFTDALDAACAAHPDKLAVVDGGRRVTYRNLSLDVERTAGALTEAGVGRGDVVTSRLPNGIEAMVLCLAAGRIGAVHNPVVTSHRDHELRAIAADARTALFVDDPGDEVFARAPGAPAARSPAAPDSPRFLLYTSGSTARPKGVLHSDRTLLAECAAQARYHRLGAGDVFVVPSSVAHVSGLVYGILLPVFLGATTVMMSRWDPAAFLALVEAERATFCGGAPVFLEGATDHPEVSRRDLSSLRVFPVGGADVSPDLVRRAARRLGVRTGRGYGSTEFPSITSGAGPDTPDARRATTDGRPIGANEIRIRDGEIEARGPELCCGYTDARLDAEAFTDDGWLRTGDLGVVDDAGYLIVTGRRNDVIVRLGEKISAREVEQLLAEHPAVRDVAVIALPDARTGERACACIVPADPAAPPARATLAGFLEARGLSRRKLPEQVAVFDALPTTPAGKPDKHALRARLRAGVE